MDSKKYQVKDIDKNKVLEEFAKHQGKWAFVYDDNVISWGVGKDEVISNILTSYPRKVVLEFFKKMINKGYLGGCACGCRGDFEITDKGLELINQKRTTKYNGY